MNNGEVSSCDPYVPPVYVPSSVSNLNGLPIRRVLVAEHVTERWKLNEARGTPYPPSEHERNLFRGLVREQAPASGWVGNLRQRVGCVQRGWR